MQNVYSEFVKVDPDTKNKKKGIGKIHTNRAKATWKLQKLMGSEF